MSLNILSKSLRFLGFSEANRPLTDLESGVRTLRARSIPPFQKFCRRILTDDKTSCNSNLSNRSRSHTDMSWFVTYSWNTFCGAPIFNLSTCSITRLNVIWARHYDILFIHAHVICKDLGYVQT